MRKRIELRLLRVCARCAILKKIINNCGERSFAAAKDRFLPWIDLCGEYADLLGSGGYYA